MPKCKFFCQKRLTIHRQTYAENACQLVPFLLSPLPSLRKIVRETFFKILKEKLFKKQLWATTNVAWTSKKGKFKKQLNLPASSRIFFFFPSKREPRTLPYILNWMIFLSPCCRRFDLIVYLKKVLTFGANKIFMLLLKSPTHSTQRTMSKFKFHFVWHITFWTNTKNSRVSKWNTCNYTRIWVPKPRVIVSENKGMILNSRKYSKQFSSTNFELIRRLFCFPTNKPEEVSWIDVTWQTFWRKKSLREEIFSEFSRGEKKSTKNDDDRERKQRKKGNHYQNASKRVPKNSGINWLDMRCKTFQGCVRHTVWYKAEQDSKNWLPIQVDDFC